MKCCNAYIICIRILQSGSFCQRQVYVCILLKISWKVLARISAVCEGCDFRHSYVLTQPGMCPVMVLVLD